MDIIAYFILVSLFATLTCTASLPDNRIKRMIYCSKGFYMFCPSTSPPPPPSGISIYCNDPVLCVLCGTCGMDETTTAIPDITTMMMTTTTTIDEETTTGVESTTSAMIITTSNADGTTSAVETTSSLTETTTPAVEETTSATGDVTTTSAVP